MWRSALIINPRSIRINNHKYFPCSSPEPLCSLSLWAAGAAFLPSSCTSPHPTSVPEWGPRLGSRKSPHCGRQERKCCKVLWTLPTFVSPKSTSSPIPSQESSRAEQSLGLGQPQAPPELSVFSPSPSPTPPTQNPRA